MFSASIWELLKKRSSNPKCTFSGFSLCCVFIFSRISQDSALWERESVSVSTFLTKKGGGTRMVWKKGDILADLQSAPKHPLVQVSSLHIPKKVFSYKC